MQRALTIILRIAVLAVAIASLPYTREAEHVFVQVSDPAFCHPHVAGDTFQLLDNSCVYQDVRLEGSWLARTFTVTGAEGRVTVRHADLLSSQGTPPSRPTWRTFCMYAVAGWMFVATLRVLWQLVTRRTRKEGSTASRWQLGFVLVALTVTDAYFIPDFAAIYAQLRIASHEADVRADPLADSAALVRRSPGSNFYRLGPGTYDRLLRLSGAGCRAYTRMGTPVTAAEFEADRPIPLDAIPNDSIFRGPCIAPDFSPPHA